MSRTRLVTTADRELLERARRMRPGSTDAVLVDEALYWLAERARTSQVDDAYASYGAHPLDEPDAWGDLASFRRAAAAS